MQKISFNRNWTVQRQGGDGFIARVQVPHDAMLSEPRSIESAGIHNIGWFVAHDYVYTKQFEADKAWRGKKVLLVFEAVYHGAEIWVNGTPVPSRAYGYTQIVVDTEGLLRYGEENEVRVLAHNADQPNSRWYSGTGIYRPVWLYVGAESWIAPYGLKVRTTGIAPARIEVSCETGAAGEVELEILDEQGRAVATKMAMASEAKRMDAANAAAHAPFLAKAEIEVPSAQLWSEDSPALYTCRARFAGDEATVSFGIRSLSWDADRGLTVNGKRVILRGACIHSDNQLLGAVSVPEAEERRVKLLKAAGYNAIRSAHNPASDSLLAACDRLGVYMMDEYVDCWYIHKNKYDYAGQVPSAYRADLADMVDKDFNHPSVILYSTGNEVAETGQKRGIALTDEMTRFLHSLDPSRPVTCGINIFFNFMYAMGFGVYSDDKAEKEAAKKPGKKKKAVGSEFYNQLAGLLGDRTMKMGAALKGSDIKTRGAFAKMDVAGYNYGILRYKKDLRHYPQRLILGSETFCKDAYTFWELAKQHPRILGDFVWAGQDYLGEAGIGSWEYEDYAPKNADQAGWLSAGSGRLDLTGKALGEADYTRVAFELEKGPRLAVRPVYQTGKHSPSAWKMSDAVRSWSWRGCDGIKAQVEVYARAAKVDLILNGKTVGSKAVRRDCVVRFSVPYEDGALEAVSYDHAGAEIGRDKLVTAAEQTCLSLLPEAKEAEAGKLVYVRLRYADAAGIWQPMEKHEVHVSVENGELVALGNACPYNPDGFLQDRTRTYYGEALAIVRAGAAGAVRVTVKDEAREETLELPVRG